MPFMGPDAPVRLCLDQVGKGALRPSHRCVRQKAPHNLGEYLQLSEGRLALAAPLRKQVDCPGTLLGLLRLLASSVSTK